MKISPLPTSEKERLEALLSYQILDTEAEPDFDGIVQLASELCGTSIALISLIDEHRQWFKARVGLEVHETPRDISFCAHAIHEDDIMMVNDTIEDDRFADNPLVTKGPKMRFYAGMPLITDKGFKLGTLCVFDQKPKVLNDKQRLSLRILARHVVNLLDLRIKNIHITSQALDLQKVRENLERAEEQTKMGSWHISLKTQERYWSKQMFVMFGFDPNAPVPDWPDLLERIHPQDQDIVKEAYAQIKNGSIPEIRVFRTNPEFLPLLHFLPFIRSTRDEKGELLLVEGTILDITERKVSEDRLIESENSLRTIIQTEPECIKLLGPKGELLYMNPAGLAMIEADSLEQIIGQPIQTLVDPRFRDAFISLTEDVFAGKSGQLEFEMTGLRGTHRWIETHSVPLRNSSGKIISVLAIARDCTERNKNVAAVQEAEERFRSLFENAIDGIFQSTPEGKFITVNPAMARIFGYTSPEELMSAITNMGEQLYVDPGVRAEIRSALEKDGMVTGTEVKTQRKNKETIWVRLNLRPIYYDDGNIRHFDGMVKDITDQKRVKAQLIREKELADSIINSLPGIFYLYNQQGKFLRWNSNFEKVTGYINDEIASMHPTDFFQEGADRNFLISKINSVFDNGYDEVEIDLYLKSKEKIAYYFNGWRIEYEDQQCLIGVGIDISDRKKAEIELRNSENKIRAFFRSTPDASILMNSKFEVLAFNPAAGRLAENTSGHELKEGDNTIGLSLPALRPVLTEFLSKALNGHTSQGEFLLPNIKTGRSTWWLGVFMPALDVKGNIFGVVSNLTNIDDIKETELKLKEQFAELKKTNHELDRFVYSVSHDLRAPLATILGLINIAELESPSVIFSNYLKLMKTSINQLDGVVKDILDYSQNARKDIESEQIDFEDLINRCKADLQIIGGSDRIHLITTVSGLAPFYSDVMRLKLIFMNLLANAIKYQDYNKEGSQVIIHITNSPKETSIVFSDNGIGIEEEHLMRVFDMFYRASEYSKGAGLGLYIVKETIERLGGKIEVASKIRSYTTFKIILPNAR